MHLQKAAWFEHAAQQGLQQAKGDGMVSRAISIAADRRGTMFLHHSKAIGALGAMGLAVSACASVIEGTTQQIAVNTNPPGADCGLYREEGIRIAAIQKTPGKALIEKTKNDIWIVCVKQGYQQPTELNHSGVAGAVFVNVIGGVFTLGISTVIGAAVDSSNGSANKYDSPINVSMVANSPDLPEGPIILPQNFNAPKPAQDGLQQAAPRPASSQQVGRPTAGKLRPPCRRHQAQCPLRSAQVAGRVESTIPAIVPIHTSHLSSLSRRTTRLPS
jgi:hypothetical protein